MSKNEPAFPLTEDAVGFKNADFPMQGLTKLEWFAGMALMGQLANSKGLPLSASDEALIAFDYAEAMIAESERRK